MIDVIIDNPHNYHLQTKGLENVVARVFLIKNITVAQVGITVVDEPTMIAYNQNYKHHAGATDVLSFVLHDPEQPTPQFVETAAAAQLYGDIVLCYPIILQEAHDLGITVQEQLEFLTEHACWHLLGVHHD